MEKLKEKLLIMLNILPLPTKLVVNKDYANVEQRVIEN